MRPAVHKLALRNDTRPSGTCRSSAGTSAVPGSSPSRSPRRRGHLPVPRAVFSLRQRHQGVQEVGRSPEDAQLESVQRRRMGVLIRARFPEEIRATLIRLTISDGIFYGVIVVPVTLPGLWAMVATAPTSRPGTRSGHLILRLSRATFILLPEKIISRNLLWSSRMTFFLYESSCALAPAPCGCSAGSSFTLSLGTHQVEDRPSPVRG